MLRFSYKFISGMAELFICLQIMASCQSNVWTFYLIKLLNKIFFIISLMLMRIIGKIYQLFKAQTTNVCTLH